MSLKMQYDDNMGNFMNLNPIMFNVGCLGSMVCIIGCGGAYPCAYINE